MVVSPAGSHPLLLGTRKRAQALFGLLVMGVAWLPCCHGDTCSAWRSQHQSVSGSTLAVLQKTA